MKFCHSHFLTICIQRGHVAVPLFVLPQSVVKERSPEVQACVFFLLRSFFETGRGKSHLMADVFILFANNDVKSTPWHERDRCILVLLLRGFTFTLSISHKGAGTNKLQTTVVGWMGIIFHLSCCTNPIFVLNSCFCAVIWYHSVLKWNKWKFVLEGIFWSEISVLVSNVHLLPTELF